MLKHIFDTFIFWSFRLFFVYALCDGPQKTARLGTLWQNFPLNVYFGGALQPKTLP